VLQKVQQQHKDKMTNFLKQIPFISHWSKSLLTKLYYSIEKVNFIRGQKVIKEGDPVEYIYIVNQGEYEVVKYLGKGDEEDRVKNEEEQLIRPLLAREDAKRCRAIKLTKEWHNPSRFKRKIRLSVLGECKLLCDSDARFGKPSSVTISTNSTNGELFKIKMTDFMKHLKNDEEAWNNFTLY
jgi:CRP-like cAMP-binding protein